MSHTAASFGHGFSFATLAEEVCDVKWRDVVIAHACTRVNRAADVRETQIRETGWRERSERSRGILLTMVTPGEFELAWKYGIDAGHRFGKEWPICESSWWQGCGARFRRCGRSRFVSAHLPNDGSLHRGTVFCHVCLILRVTVHMLLEAQCEIYVSLFARRAVWARVKDRISIGTPKSSVERSWATHCGQSVRVGGLGADSSSVLSCFIFVGPNSVWKVARRSEVLCLVRLTSNQLADLI